MFRIVLTQEFLNSEKNQINTTSIDNFGNMQDINVSIKKDASGLAWLSIDNNIDISLDRRLSDEQSIPKIIDRNSSDKHNADFKNDNKISGYFWYVDGNKIGDATDLKTCLCKMREEHGYSWAAVSMKKFNITNNLLYSVLSGRRTTIPLALSRYAKKLVEENTYISPEQFLEDEKKSSNTNFILI